MADCSDSYEERFQALIDQGKPLSDAYEASHECTIKFYDSCPKTSDYRKMGWKPSRTFTWPYRDGQTHCPRCDGTSCSSASITAGCRHNGDGYGSDIVFCSTCGLLDWASYDDA